MTNATDCGKTVEELPVNDNIKMLVDILTHIKTNDKNRDKIMQSYYAKIAASPKASLIKCIDRCNNLTTMSWGLSIAQAIMESPKLLLLDEPFNGLDEKGVILLKNLIKDLNNKGCTIILTSHNKEDLNELCTVIYKISGNKLVLSQNDNLNI